MLRNLRNRRWRWSCRCAATVPAISAISKWCWDPGIPAELATGSTISGGNLGNRCGTCFIIIFGPPREIYCKKLVFWSLGHDFPWFSCQKTMFFIATLGLNSEGQKPVLVLRIKASFWWGGALAQHVKKTGFFLVPGRRKKSGGN